MLAAGAAAYCGRGLDLGQDPVLRRIGQAVRRLRHRQGQADRDLLARLVVVENQARTGRLDPVLEFQLVRPLDQPVDHGNDVLGAERRGLSGQHDHAHSGNGLGHDVICWHGTLSGDVAEPGLDSEELVHVLAELALQLGPAQGQHAA